MQKWKSFVAAACAAFSIGCASMERTALNSINASITTSENFVTWADLNRDSLDPRTAAIAEGVRTKAPHYWAGAYSALQAYRGSRNEDTEMELTRQVARVDGIKQAVEEIRSRP